MSKDEITKAKEEAQWIGAAEKAKDMGITIDETAKAVEIMSVKVPAHGYWCHQCELTWKTSTSYEERYASAHCPACGIRTRPVEVKVTIEVIK